MQREKEREGRKINEGNTSPASPPSASSSPSHEFSFTISLHPHPHPPPTGTKIPDKNTKSTPQFAIDLSPADDIFFHGHLLPLHLLSHLPVSPRSSTNSLDSFTLPIKDFCQDNPHNNDSNNNSNNKDDDQEYSKPRTSKSQVLEIAKRRENPNSNPNSNSKPKSKSFSIFRWRRDDHKGDDDRRRQQQNKKRLRFDVSRVVKRYLRLVKPFLSLRRGQNRQFQRQPYSYSGNLRMRRSKKELRKGEFSSAPASMSTSPTNSGLLVPSGSVTPTGKSDSTMEELQAAIQAAIAHCKKSIAASDQDKLI